MKKILHLFKTAFCISLTLSSLHAMDPAPAQQATYSLVKAFRTEWKFASASFIKQLSGQYLVAFDRKGIGILFDAQNGFKEVQSFFAERSSQAQDAFLYQGSNKDLLLITFNDRGLDVCNVISGMTYPIEIDYEFVVYQNLVNELILVNMADKSAWIIDVHFNEDRPYLENVKHPRFEDLLFGKGGLITSALMLNLMECPQLSEKMFDIASLTEQEYNIVTYPSFEGDVGILKPIRCFRSISCYHKMADGRLIAGHSCGLISIWNEK